MSKDRHNGFIELFKAIHPLSSELKNFIIEKTQLASFKKGAIICRENSNCHKLMYIKKGVVRGYFNYGGKEITTWISFDHEVFTSISGYFSNEPCKENIQAIDDTIVEYISQEDFKMCFTIYNESNIVYKRLLEQYYRSAEERAFLARIPVAKDRYEYYSTKINPDHLHKIPKKYLSSLLNMQPETLTRITTALKSKSDK